MTNGKSMTWRVGRMVPGLLFVASAVGCHIVLGLDGYYLDCRRDDVACPCVTEDDCGAPPTCRVWLCLEGVCRKRNADHGAPCRKGSCWNPEGALQSPEATCGECAFDSDCPGERGYCHEGSCFSCDNGIDDGDEWEVDCGGSHCPECLGNPCSSDAECWTGFCTDGHCCEIRCHDVCAECYTGICQNVRRMEIDYDPPCIGDNRCNGGGFCALAEYELCKSDVECASFHCVAGRCADLWPPVPHDEFSPSPP